MLSAAMWCVAIFDDPTPATVELKSRIVSASVFKPGIAMIVREVKVPAGKGKYKLDVLPDILDGSFWYGSNDGAVVGDVQTKLRIGEKSVKTEAKSIAEYLTSNEGKQVKLTVANAKGGEDEVEGTIVSVSPQITIKLANGHLRTVNIGSVVDLDPTGLSSAGEIKVPTVNEQIDFEVTASKPATVRFLTLENGAAWQGSYMVVLGDQDAKITGKAQLVVGGLKFENTDVQVLAGLPALPKDTKFDLAAGVGSMVAWLRGAQEPYRALREGPRDPYTLIQSVLQQAQSRVRTTYADSSTFAGYGFGGGGFGGGQGAYVGAIGTADFDAQYSNSSQAQQERSADESLARVEDLYSYPLGKVSLDPGDRLTRILVDESAHYERLYRWEVSMVRSQPYDQPHERDRVVKLLRLQNRGKLPWTGGKALVMKDNNPLAETDMPFTAAGQDASLELGDVQDIPVNRTSKELRREQTTILGRYYNAVTVETTLTVENPRSEAITMEIRHDVGGEVLSAEGAEITVMGTALTSANKNSRVQWTITLKPGEKRQFTMTTKTLV